MFPPLLASVNVTLSSRPLTMAGFGVYSAIRTVKTIVRSPLTILQGVCAVVN